MDEPEPKDEADPQDQLTTPVPHEPAQPPVMERPEERPEQPVGYAKVQRPAVESLSPTLSGRPTAGQHLRTAGTALVNWWRAVSIEALCVAVLWLIGLEILRVPLAPAWALVAGLMAFVPNIGGVIALIGPVLSILFQGKDYDRLAFLLGIYAIIVVIDQVVLQPWLMKRMARVPLWASILVPLVLAFNPITPFWGVLLAPPLLAVIYAFRKPKQKRFT
ncbi:MAG TPA: AI-2E family transporter [Acidobacteriaceae bacterium]|jgi:predicted PurR-regulated permease PerM